MLSHELGTLSAVFGIMACLGVITRKLPVKNKLLRQLFRGKFHRIWGDLMLLTGIFHGGMAMVSGQWNNLLLIATGVFVCMAWVVLSVTASKRKTIGVAWIRWHRATAALMMLVLLVHCSCFE